MQKKIVQIFVAAVAFLTVLLFQADSAQAASVHTNTMQDVQQLVLVTTSSKKSSYATVTAYERTAEGKWISKKKTTKGRVGWAGITPIASRRQGTGKTPQGILKLVRAMGNKADPGAIFPYTRITNAMYWNLNSGTSTYNQLVTKDPKGDREHLIDYPSQYGYLFTTDYNVEQIADKGGAIFFHCNGSGATAGCISVPTSIMKWYVKWLDPQKNPVILVTTASEVQKYLVPTTTIKEVKASSANSLTLSWKQVYGSYRYVVQRASSKGGPYQNVKILKPSVTSWTDTTANSKKVYYYRIKTYAYLDGAKKYAATSPAVCNKVYYVTYKANGGTGTMKKTTVPYQYPTALRKNVFQRSGYTFQGWYAYRVSDKKWYTVGHGWKKASTIKKRKYEKYLYPDRQKVSKQTATNNTEIRMTAVWKKKGRTTP
ncbi:MAG: InlB B-repeat-containing protein [Eubacteriales bacterium]|nr:InlB B-repeat-containing protein [Eubacteriales bacterium]